MSAAAVHFGTHTGPTGKHHGMSRSEQHVIVTERGFEAFAHECPNVTIGTRVSFDFGVNSLGEQVAVNVQAVEQPKPTKPAKTGGSSISMSRVQNWLLIGLCRLIILYP